MHLAATTFLLAFLLIGCATPNLRHAEHPTSFDWKKGNFHVHFQAGPQGREGRSYSFYKIKHSIADQQERSLVMESAHSLEGFGCVTNGHPKNWIRIIEDPNGKALLIEEGIPNDCGPCSNYLWLRLDADGFIEGTYLLLPPKVTGLPGGIDDEYPKVRSLDGGVLTYDYRIGGSVTKRIDHIETATQPSPPG